MNSKAIIYISLSARFYWDPSSPTVNKNIDGVEEELDDVQEYSGVFREYSHPRERYVVFNSTGRNDNHRGQKASTKWSNLCC